MYLWILCEVRFFLPILESRTTNPKQKHHIEIMVEYDDDNSYAAELRKKPICRFCLSQEDTLTNIYSTSNTNSQVALSMQIMACVSIEVIYQVCACVFWFSSVLHCMAKLGQLLQHFFASLPLLRAIEVEKNNYSKSIWFLGFFPLVNWQRNAEDSCRIISRQTNHIGCMYWESGNFQFISYKLSFALCTALSPLHICVCV